MFLYKITTLLFLYFACFFPALFAQNQNNQWRFGLNGALNFNTTPPGSPAGCALQTPEGSASVADRVTGALLFYTDGITIWNANDQPMPNGSGLLGGTSVLLSSTTAAVIVPKPASPGIFYVITIDEQSSGNGIRYSVVDMSLNGGLGDVVSNQKNIFLWTTTSEKLHVVPNADGCGYWLLSHDNPGNTFLAFKITEAGVQTTPVLSSAGGSQGNGAGHIKVNRQFNKIAIGNLFDGTIELSDFDNATGVVSNPVSWPFSYPNGLIYGVEFSPDGTKLYVSNIERIVQYDVSQPTADLIEASAFEVSLGTGAAYKPATLQLGPDDKIYVAAETVDAINFPNNAGTSCGFQRHVIVLENSVTGYGLPQWIYYNDALASTNQIVVQNTCLNEITQFSLQNSLGTATVNWNFGDPLSGADNTANTSNPTHVFSQTGSYTVQAIINYACSTDTISQNVDIAGCTVNITGIKIDGDTCSTTNIAFQVIGTSNSPYFFWDFGDPASGSSDTTTITGNSPVAFPTHTFSGPGIYNVCASFQEPGLAVSTVCRTLSIGLCCSGIISVSDTCLENSIAFSVVTAAVVNSIVWDFGDPASGLANTATNINSTHTFSEAGTYQVQAIVNADCGADTIIQNVDVANCDCNLYIPNAFTPNEDGINDRFQPVVNCTTTQFEYSIFNRWGELIFTTSNLDDNWNGKYKGKDCPMDVYVYLVTYTPASASPKILYGDITLLR